MDVHALGALALTPELWLSDWVPPDKLAPYIIFCVGRATGSFISGELVSKAGLTVPEVFWSMGASGIVRGALCYIFYRAVSAETALV